MDSLSADVDKMKESVRSQVHCRARTKGGQIRGSDEFLHADRAAEGCASEGCASEGCASEGQHCADKAKHCVSEADSCSSQASGHDQLGKNLSFLLDELQRHQALGIKFYRAGGSDSETVVTSGHTSSHCRQT